MYEYYSKLRTAANIHVHCIMEDVATRSEPAVRIKPRSNPDGYQPRREFDTVLFNANPLGQQVSDDQNNSP
jgi:hypothetical protein